ncbi:uncharacterized protein LOC100215628 [Hydra vulgaris]|uniref:uncharacterized protein LOC100215628 n=1 Tax=Hydra vulgaris TaxID=6087 RepID=UPI0001926366|nr:uncharacterized protein LOC100215628 [Hydra vulgaris]
MDMSTSLSSLFGRNIFCSRILFLLIMINFIKINKALTLVPSTLRSCQSNSDCMTDECCAAQQHGGVGRCEKMLTQNAPCLQQYDIKIVFLANGGIAKSKCGCQSGLICTKLQRNNWNIKKREWSEEERQKKTKYKLQCKPIPGEVDEIIENK